MKYLTLCLLVVLLRADTQAYACYTTATGYLYFSTSSTCATGSAITAKDSTLPIAFSISGITGAVPTAAYIPASQLTGNLDSTVVGTFTASNLFGTIPTSLIDQSGATKISPDILPTIPTTLLASNLQAIPAGFNGTFSSLSGQPFIFSGDYNQLTNKPNTDFIFLGFLFAISVVAIIGMFVCLRLQDK